jgi:aspartate racemase
VLHSLDFSEIRECQVAGDWGRAGALLAEAARHCVDSGADVVAICTNLMHKVAPEVEAAIDVPLLHIADAVAAEGERRDFERLGILGTRWVMEEPFYADRLARHGKQAVTPDAADRELVDRIVFEELTQGKVLDRSRSAYLDVVGRLAEQGAEAVVLACTEIGLLIGPEDSPLPIIDSAEVHALELARAALAAPASR